MPDSATASAHECKTFLGAFILISPAQEIARCRNNSNPKLTGGGEMLASVVEK